MTNNKHFYHKVINFQEILVELDTLNLSDHERNHLATLIESNLHHTVLDAVLSELSEEDKKHFIENFAKLDHDDIWKFLNNRVEKIEDKIKKTADDLKDEMLEDIKQAKRRKS